MVRGVQELAFVIATFAVLGQLGSIFLGKRTVRSKLFQTRSWSMPESAGQRWLVETMLTADEIKFLLQMHRRYSSGSDDLALKGISEEADRAKLQTIVGRLTDKINGMTGQNDLADFATIRRTFYDGIDAHSDNSRWETSSKRWVPNHTPTRSFAASMMLSNRSAYEGGTFRFHEPLQEDYEMDPGNGLVFDCSEANTHSVDTVIGERMVFLVWLKRR